MSNIVLRNLNTSSLVNECFDEADKVLGGAIPFPPLNFTFSFAKSTTSVKQIENALEVGGSAVFQQEIQQTALG